MGRNPDSTKYDKYWKLKDPVSRHWYYRVTADDIAYTAYVGCTTWGWFDGDRRSGGLDRMRYYQDRNQLIEITWDSLPEPLKHLPLV